MKKLFCISMCLLAFCFIGCDKENGDKNDDGDGKTPGGNEQTYDIGDYYNVNGVKGIVYKVSNNGKNGMIISMDQQAEKPWQKAPYTETGATDEENGKTNFNTIKNGGFDLEDFPALKWCNDKNTGNITGWYLPAVNEAADIAASLMKIQLALNQHGGVTFHSYTMWTSTEIDEDNAFCYDLSNKESEESLKNNFQLKMTRAVRAF